MGGSIPKLRLHYFKGPRSRAEYVRIAAAYYGISMQEEKLVTMDEWASAKETYPTKTLPALEVNGEFFGETRAIMQYLARLKGEYPPTNPKDGLLTDSLINYMFDLINNYIEAYHVRFLADLFQNIPIHENPFDEKEEKFFTEKLMGDLKVLQGYLEKNGGGESFFGDSTSLADIVLFAVIDMISTSFSEKLALETNFPVIFNHFNRIKKEKGLVEYLANRPEKTW